jgi:hypothetical protein
MESRGHLYREIASLIRLDASYVVPLVEHAVSETGWTVAADLPLIVLGQLAADGDAAALNALVAQVDGGAFGAAAIEQLQRLPEDPGAVGPLIAARLPDEEFRDNLLSHAGNERFDVEPWLTWRREPAVDAYVRATVDRLSRQGAPPGQTIDIASDEAVPGVPTPKTRADAEAVFSKTRSSRVRLQAARILQAASRTFAATLAFECLWDCERETRELEARVGRARAPSARRIEKALSPGLFP